MLYNQPYDQPGTPDAPYVNGNPSVGLQGSIPPAAAFEYPQREIMNLITGANLTPSNSDLTQLAQAIQSGKVKFGVDSGTANAMVVGLNPVPKVLTIGMQILVKKIASANTGATTLDIGFGGANAVRAQDGSPLISGALPASAMILCAWTGAVWQVLSGAAGAGGTNTFNLSLPYAVDSSVTPNTITAAFSPAITTLSAGQLVAIKLANTITGAATCTIDANPSKAVKRPDGTALHSGDGKAGQVALFEYDGTNLQFVTAPVGNPAYSTGQIVQVFTPNPPTGTLAAEGAAVSRTTYAALFAVIGVMYGAGDGTTTFTLPDVRGHFLRAWNHGAGKDPDAVSRTNRGDGVTGDFVGTKQLDAFQGHWHSSAAGFDGIGLSGSLNSTSTSNVFVHSPIADDLGNGTPRTTKETRPLNINVLVCIAY